jgi:hypothetical protein
MAISSFCEEDRFDSDVSFICSRITPMIMGVPRGSHLGTALENLVAIWFTLGVNWGEWVAVWVTLGPKLIKARCASKGPENALYRHNL